MEERQSDLPENNGDQSNGNENKDKPQLRDITEGLTYKNQHGEEYRLKNVKPVNAAGWKRQKRIGILIALGIIVLFVPVFLLKCTAVSPWVYSMEEKKNIALEEMEKRYDKDFEIMAFNSGGGPLGPAYDMITVKVKNSSNVQKYGILGYLIDEKYEIYDNYFAKAIITNDYEAVIREILNKELGEYKLRRIDMSGYNNYVNYSDKDTRLDELYDLGMKYGPQYDDSVTLFRPDIEIDIPDSLNSKQDIKATITEIMDEFSKRKLVLSFGFNVIKDEAILIRGTETEPYMRDDLLGFYLSRVENDLTIVVDNYYKY